MICLQDFFETASFHDIYRSPLFPSLTSLSAHLNTSILSPPRPPTPPAAHPASHTAAHPLNLSHWGRRRRRSRPRRRYLHPKLTEKSPPSSSPQLDSVAGAAPTSTTATVSSLRLVSPPVPAATSTATATASTTTTTASSTAGLLVIPGALGWAETEVDRQALGALPLGAWKAPHHYSSNCTFIKGISHLMS